MIYKDENFTELDFGKGDILVTPLYWQDDNVGGVAFEQSDKHRSIGETIDSDNFNLKNQDVIMTFSNVKSIDAIIKQLNTIKETMLQNKE
jgi:hypothetical protein